MTSDLGAIDPTAPRVALRLTLWLAAIAAMNLVVGFGIQVAILRGFGAGAAADTLVAAQATPGVVYGILVGSMLSVWQPLLAVATGADRKHRASLALGQTLAILGIVAGALALTAGLWTPVLFPGFHGESLRVATELGRVLLITLVLSGATAILGGFARAEGRFLVGEGVPLLVSLASLVALPLAITRGGLNGAAWLLVARSALAFLMLWVVLGRLWPDFTGHPLNRQALRSASPILAGSSLYKLSPLLDRFLASQAGAGGMALFNVAQTGASALTTVIDRAVGSPVAPALARSWANGEFRNFRSIYRRAMLATWLPVLGLAVALAALWPVWDSIISLVLHLTLPQARLLYGICFGLLGLVGVGACGAVAVAAFYALGDTRTPMTIGLIGFALSFGLKFFGYFEAGLIGLAWASSLYYLVNLTMTWLLLERRVRHRVAAGR